MFSFTMTHPVILECYFTSPKNEKKRRERQTEDIELISCEFFSISKRKNGSFKRFLSQPLISINLYTLDVITFFNIRNMAKKLVSTKH